MNDQSVVKGYAYLSYVEPLMEEREDFWLRVRGRMSSESRAFFDAEIFADQWYPRAHLHALMKAIDEVTGGDPREFRELGARAARYQVSAIYRVFLSFITPALVFRRAASIWRRQSSAGEFTVVEDGENCLVGKLVDRELPMHMPLVMAGWSETIVAMLGRTPYPVDIEAGGPGVWRFRIRWIAA